MAEESVHERNSIYGQTDFWDESIEHAPLIPDWLSFLFDLMDEDYDGEVSVDEFAKAVRISLHGDIEAKANWVFILMDVDADNMMSRLELRKALHLFCDPSNEQRRLLKNRDMLFRGMDKDGDGWVSPEEFVKSAIAGGGAKELVDLILEDKGCILAVILGLIRYYGWPYVFIPDFRP